MSQGKIQVSLQVHELHNKVANNPNCGLVEAADSPTVSHTWNITGDPDKSTHAVTNIHHTCSSQSSLIVYIRTNSLSCHLLKLHRESLDWHLFRWASRWADVDPKNPRKVPCLLSHNWRGPARSLPALWLLDLDTSPWTNGNSENDSIFRQKRQREGETCHVDLK